MRQVHRSGRQGAALVALVGALLAASLIGPPVAGADADKTGVRAITTQTAPLVPGQSAWLSVVWAADQTVTDWSTTVSAPAGVGVSYPTTRGGADTSLYGSATLVGSTRDFTAVKLAVPYSQTTPFQITLLSSYTGTCGDNGQCKEQGGGNDDKVRRHSTTATVTVPVQPAVGPPFTQVTSSLSVPAGSNDFQEIAFTGGQADLSDVSVRLGALPAGLAVAYPGDATASRLAGGSSLVGGSTDHVAVRFDVTGLAPGTYVLPLVVDHTAAARQSVPGTVTLVVG
ncbi:hypothetical protein [Modestobacter sp. VKM Ac-2985]|uniref:hypothetical protein n=1 Tax=Modestobacter sp. VKM Ac-2985 TaxID=3004139 RepID=UPI0022AB986C|nr:hypothetical protein [Modestobacter sp. VKM Ac-2985]MCZ2835900.1 hypothetical protein [Modestobacter sp. VKM Ac-2985]